MRKRLTLIFYAVMILALVGCSNKTARTQTEHESQNIEEVETSNQNGDEIDSSTLTMETENVKMTFPANDVTKIKLSGTAFVDAITEKDSIKMTFYNSKEGLRTVRE